MLRSAIYARVSTEDQTDGYSLDAQLRACRALCESRGWQVAAEYVESGKSAHVEGARNRPEFQRMLASVDRREIDVIVVHKLDRFSRHMTTTLVTMQRLARAGAVLASVTESVDLSTPTGKVFFAILAAFAEFYSDNLSGETSKGKQERRKQGLYNAFLPFGYTRDPASQKARAVIEPTEAEGVRLAFRMAAEGVTAWEIARALNDAGHRTHGPHGRNPFTRDTVLALLRNRFYLGELAGGLPGQHAPILTAEQFDAARAGVAGRVHRTECVTREARTFSTTGIVWCGRCGSRMNTMSSRGWYRIYCSRRRQKGDCDQPSISHAELESAVEGWLIDVADPDIDAALAALTREMAVPDDAELERKRLTQRLERLKNLYLLGDVTDAEYRSQRDEMVVTLAGLARPASETRLEVERTAALMRDASATWHALSQGDRNVLLAALVERIVVNDDRVEIVARPDVARLVPSSKSRRRRDSHSGLTVRHRPRVSPYSPEALQAMAYTARQTSIRAAAKAHRTSRQTIRRALGPPPPARTG